MSESKKPRWINETPGIINTGQKRKLTEQEKQEVKEFEEAVHSGKIDKWFNKK